MPQIDLKYSGNLNIDVEKLFHGVEFVIHESDGSAGDCKARAYPAKAYVHDHVLLEVTLLKKPHRDDVFMKSLRDKVEAVLVTFLPKGCYYAIELRFAGEYYLTAQVS